MSSEEDREPPATPELVESLKSQGDTSRARAFALAGELDSAAAIPDAPARAVDRAVKARTIIHNAKRRMKFISYSLATYAVQEQTKRVADLDTILMRELRQGMSIDEICATTREAISKTFPEDAVSKIMAFPIASQSVSVWGDAVKRLEALAV